MNRIYTVVAALMLVTMSLPVSSGADEIGDFVISLNNAWGQTNNAQMLTLINGRLQTNTNDVVGLSAKMYYYVFVDCILTNARQVAGQFYAAVANCTNEQALSIAAQMTNEVSVISLSESNPLGTNEVAQMHVLFPASFPMIDKCAWVARKAQ